MKKNFKRWLALMLAVVMVSGTFLSHTENFLQATDEQAVEATQEEKETVANEKGEKIAEQTVQQPQPVEEKQKVEIPKQEEKETPKEEPKQETPKAEESKQEAPKAEEPKKESNQETPAEKVEKTFDVTFTEPKTNGGTLRVWAEGEDKKEVSYNSGKYVKETKEDTTLYFEIKTKDNYKLDQVKDEDGNVLKPETKTEKTSTYKMVVKEDEKITILYKEVIQSEEPKEEEKDDEVAAPTKVPAKAPVQARGKVVTVTLNGVTIRDGHDAEWGNGDQGWGEKPTIRVTAEEGIPFQLNASTMTSGYHFTAGMMVGGKPVNEADWTFSFAETNNTRAYIYAFKIVDGELFYTLDANWGETTNWIPYMQYGATDVSLRYNIDRSVEDIYVVQYLGNGHTNGAPEKSREETTKNGTVRLSGRGSLAKKGYEFAGWTLSEDGSGTVYQPGQEYTVTKAITYFYAKWEKVAEKYTVTFDSNGGTPVTSQTVEGGKKATEPENPTREGYTFDGWYLNNQKYNFDTAVTKNITLTAKWKKDLSQTKTLKYTVKYTIEGEEQTKDTKEYSETVWVNEDNQLKIQKGSLEKKDYTGYKFEKMTPEAKEGEEVANGTVITLNYVKDADQTKMLKYTVKHTIEGEEQTKDTKEYSKTVWVNEDNQLKIQKGSLEKKDYTGYKFEKMTPEVKEGEEVANGTVITLNYVKDESQTKELKYTVKHVIEGVEQTKDTKEYSKTVWVNEDNNLTVQKGSLAHKTYEGYKFDSMEPEVTEGTEVANRTTITLNYVKDESQTQDTIYTVKHVVDGVEKESKSYKGTAWINDVNPKITIQKGSLAQNTYTGYKFAGISPAVKEGDQVGSGTEIILTYVKNDEETKTLAYTVKHVVDGVERATQDYTETVWINAEDELTVQEGSLAQNTYTGYKYDGMTPEVEVGEKVANGTTITLNYVKDETQTKELKYTVKHVVDGVEKESKDYTETVWVNEDDKLEIQKSSLKQNTYKGYKFDSMTPEDVKEGSEVANGTTITLNYVKDESQTQETSYTVKHVVDGVEKASKSYTGTAWINDKNPTIEVETGSVEPKEYEGYKFEAMNPMVKDGDRIANGTEIVLTYTADFSAVAATGVNKVYNGDKSEIEVAGLLPTDTVRYFVNGETVENSFIDVIDKDVVVEVTRGSEEYTVPAVDVIITARPLTITANSASKEYDGVALTDAGYKIADPTAETGLVKDEAISVVTVTGSQTFVGDSANTPSDAKFSKGKDTNYAINYVPGTLTVTDGSGDIPVDPDKVVTKTHEDKTYSLGDTIEFTIEATNIYDEPKTITIVEQEGVTITGESVFEDVAPGAVVTTTAEYVVTEKDILAGSFMNKVTAKFEGEKDYENTDKVTDLEDKNGHLTVTKETTSKPANNVSYVLGEKITYKITVTNDGNLTIEDIVVNDELTGNTGENAWTIESLAPGKSQEFTAEYVVTEDDLLKGSVKNVATAEGTSPDPEVPEVPVTPGEKEEPTDTAAPSLFVEKTAELKEDGTPFGLGETVDYTIKVVNNGNLTVKDITVEDDLTGETWTIESLAPKAEQTFDTTYDVTERDLVAGEVHNVATATGTAADSKTKQTVTASDDETVATIEAKASVDINKEVTTTPANEKGYALNEVIGYKITAMNTGNQTMKNVVVTDELTGDEWTIKTLAPGKSETFTTEYTVTEKDILAGKVVNVATAAGDNTNPEGSEPEVDPGETEVETEEEKPSFTADKKLTNKGTGADGAFKVGDEAKFDIVVKNTGNVTLKNVTVEERLAGATIVAGEGYTVSADGKTATIGTLAVDATITVKAVYEVTQKDVDNGKAVNSVTVEGEGSGEIDPEPVDPEEQIPTEDPKPDFESSKELTNSGSGTYGAFKVGEKAEFAITVKNTGNVTLKNLTVKEQLEGAKVVGGTGYTINADGVAVIDTLEVGATVIVNAEYQITQKDVDDAKLVNAVAVEGEGPNPIDPENPDPDPEEPEVEIPTDPHKPTALTDKVLTNAGSGENGSFKAGETATFNITVTNTGNVTLKNVVVREMLEGAKIVDGTGYKVSADGKVATIARIGVGETATVKAEYVVTQEDVDDGGTRNMATVDIPGETDPQPPTEEIPTETQKPEMTSEKTLTNEGTGENGAFEVGDVAEFDITVENTGNVTLNNITVKEQLEGAKVVSGEGYRVSGDGTEATIDTLEVGKVVVVKAEYEITQADVDNGGAVNRVIVEGEGPETPDPEKPTPDPEPVDPEEPIPTPEQNPDMNVEKTITSEQEIYRVGDMITYQITVENTGNVTLHDVVVEDTLQNAAGEVTFEKTEGVIFDGNTAVIGTIAPGQTVTLNASYVVTRADADSDISNVAIGTSEETPDPDVDETPVTPAEDLYNLTINYVYADGRTAAPSVNARYLEGETFSYASPAIAGYTPDYAFVRTSAEGMPARDVVITITYTANAVPTPTPDTPDGGDDGTTTPGTDGTTETTVPAEPAAEETVGAEIRTTDDDEVEVVPVVEEEVPLANRDLDNHECCILHFLLMLAAMVVYAMYTRSMKKRQARIAELAEELETEMLKREQQSAE